MERERTYVSRNMRFRKEESAFVDSTVNAPARAQRVKSINTNLSPRRVWERYPRSDIKMQDRTV